MPSIIERIQARIELFRLEQRYTRRRHRRSTFVSNAIYVDGEYIYNTPNTTGSSGYTSGSNSNSSNEAVAAVEEQQAKQQAKRLNRWSSMPGFGSLGRASGANMPQGDWQTSRVSVGDMR